MSSFPLQNDTDVTHITSVPFLLVKTESHDLTLLPQRLRSIVFSWAAMCPAKT